MKKFVLWWLLLALEASAAEFSSSAEAGISWPRIFGVGSRPMPAFGGGIKLEESLFLIETRLDYSEWRLGQDYEWSMVRGAVLIGLNLAADKESNIKFQVSGGLGYHRLRLEIRELDGYDHFKTCPGPVYALSSSIPITTIAQARAGFSYSRVEKVELPYHDYLENQAFEILEVTFGVMRYL